MTMATLRTSTHKRRRVSSPKHIVSPDTSTRPTTLPNTTTVVARLSCVSCYRVLNASLSLKSSSPTFCAICHSPSCTICSRTCNGFGSAPSRASSLPALEQESIPETPHLTWSPTSPALTPTPSPPLAFSPKRFALALNAANTNAAPNNATGKRKLGDEDSVDDEETKAGRGCGRTVCKNCCSENALSTVCVECLRRA
ncbi:hypothetical protein E1B28_013344 [Marasmius oreades]|uniref:Uncharacterized protein n=1 Tax=Marasmius oreades TaxID=181124 RepID=A0A9P7RQC9_9AGAR|nr:uncharacterized protein E1B28_013344 [Marasmius oreades]KAG7087370.1 hypothetical protein E1B28_013344 [Marasmius oreades]